MAGFMGITSLQHLLLLTSLIVTSLMTRGRWDEEGGMGETVGSRLSACRIFELDLKDIREIPCSDLSVSRRTVSDKRTF